MVRTKRKEKTIPPSWYNVYKTGILFRPSKLLGLFFIHTHTRRHIVLIVLFFVLDERSSIYNVISYTERIFHCRRFKVAVDGTHIILFYNIITIHNNSTRHFQSHTRRTHYITPRYWLWKSDGNRRVTSTSAVKRKKTRTSLSDCATT